MSLLGFPAKYRFLVENKTGATLNANTVKVFGHRDKVGSDGLQTFEVSPATLYDNGSTIANNTFLVGATIDNTTYKWQSGDFVFEVDTSGLTPSGDVILYVQRSKDGGTTWEDNASTSGWLTALNFTAAGIKRRGFAWGGE